MVRWVIGSILHGMDPVSYFSFQPVLHDWCNKGRGMCYPVCGMMHIKESKCSKCLNERQIRETNYEKQALYNMSANNEIT